LFEPSVIALDEQTGAVHAVGEAANRMIGRTPASIRAVRPLRHGVITDFEVTEAMLRHFLARAGEGRLRRPLAVLCVPSGITQVERRALEEAALTAGARETRLIEEPLAAAIGAGLPVEEPRATMIVDVGGGTSEVAVIALGGIVVWQSLRLGGYDMDEAIVNEVRKRHGLLIGADRAEDLKMTIGTATPAVRPQALGEATGRDLVTGQIRRVVLTPDEIGEALDPLIGRIVEAVKETLEQTLPELAADIVESGIVLAGGGVLLQGFAERLRAETDLSARLAPEPLTCVAIGAGRSLDAPRS
jgi:rod shape-determining protein MreB